MIYISCSCVNNARIRESVEEFATNGFQNIELSGGTKFYENFENDLLHILESLKKDWLMARGKKDFLTVPCMQENLKMEMQMVKEPLQINLKINSLAFGKTAN